MVRITDHQSTADIIDQVISGHDPYDQLPEMIKNTYTPEEYLWLSDHEKATLIQRETEPEA